MLGYTLININTENQNSKDQQTFYKLPYDNIKEFEKVKYNNKTITKVNKRNLWKIRYYHNKKQVTIYGKTQ